MLLSNLFAPVAGERESRASLENPAVSIHDPAAWRDIVGGVLDTDAGEPVSHGKAISLSAFWAAVKMISGDVSKLPLEVFIRDGEDRQADYAHEAYERINLSGMANEEVSALKFWRRLVVHALLYENGYAWIRRTNAGQIIGLYNLLSDRTTVTYARGRTWVLTEYGKGKPGLQALPYEDVLHVEGLTLNDLYGEDLVSRAREDIAQALAARKFTSKFFRNGAHIGGILHAPAGTSPKARDKVEKGMQAKFASADNAFKTMVLRDGFRWFATMAKPAEAQLLELDEQQVRNTARRFLMSPSRLGVRESISYNSLEAEKRDYHDTTLSYWLIAIKSECNTKLLTTEDRRSRKRFIDYNVNALHWADVSTVATIGYQGVVNGVLDPNEVRRWWNLPPREEEEEDAQAATEIQQQALNGAQISSLVEIAVQVAGGQLPEGTAKAIIQASFPTLTDAIIESIVEPLIGFSPTSDEPAPSPEPAENEPLPTRHVSPAEFQTAARANLRAALRRAANRLTVRATKAAQQPKSFTGWIDHLEQERSGCEEITCLPTTLARAAGVIGPNSDPLDHLFTRFRDLLNTAADKATADELPQYVERALSSFVASEI